MPLCFITMYLKQLYKQHKGWFLFAILFCIAQLFINYKRGVVASPFFHYGMYAAKMNIPDTIEVFEVAVNGKPLEPFHFSAQEWDKLMLPLYQYNTVQQHNSHLWNTDIQRLLSKLGMKQTNADNFLSSINLDAFTKWYREYCSSIVGYKIDSITIFLVKAIAAKNNLQIVSKEVWTK
jgi:hypothetical protein